MTSKAKKLIIASLIMNLCNFIIVTVCIILNVIGISDDFVAGIKTFKFFTNNSNMFSAAVSIAIVICDILILQGKRKDINYIVLLFKEMTTVCVTITFLIVLCVLGPIEGYYNFIILDKGMCLHVICPLLTIVSYLVCEFSTRKKQNIFIYSLFALIPVIIYGVFYITLVVGAGLWDDFYGLNTNGMIAFSCSFMVVLAYLVSLGLTFAHRKIAKKNSYLEVTEQIN